MENNENVSERQKAEEIGMKELEEKLASSQKLLKESRFEEAIESYRICCEKA